MFTQTWKKYLSIISILIKRSAAGPQTLSTNFSDFERAAGGRKIKFNFSNLQLNNGRQNYGEKLPPVATDLIQVLQENDAIATMLKNQNFLFSMGSDMLLTITNNTPVADAEEEVVAADAEAEAVAENV